MLKILGSWEKCPHCGSIVAHKDPVLGHVSSKSYPEDGYHLIFLNFSFVFVSKNIIVTNNKISLQKCNSLDSISTIWSLFYSLLFTVALFRLLIVVKSQIKQGITIEKFCSTRGCYY